MALAFGLVVPGFASATDHPFAFGGPRTVVVPTSHVVLRPTVVSVAPTIYTSYEILPTVWAPAMTWSPFVPFVQTVEVLPMEGPCLPASTVVIESPAIESTVIESQVLSSPQTRIVEELPADAATESKPVEKTDKPADEPEPGLLKESQSPPAMPEVPGSSKLPERAAAPAETPPAETKPAPAKPQTPPPTDDDVPPNLPPAKESPRGAAPPAAKPAAVDSPAASPAATSSDIPLPDADELKPAAEQPKAAPATPVPMPPQGNEAESKNLSEPKEPQIPLPEMTVPDLSPVPSAKPAAPAESPPVVPTSKEGSNLALPDLPPPASAEELPVLPETKSSTAKPVIPLPDIPPPENMPNLPGVDDSAVPVPDLSKKPVDDQAVKTGAERTLEATMKKRESQRPVIESITGAKPSETALDVLVRSSRLGSPEIGVRVLFRDLANDRRLETVSDVTGRSVAALPDGRWEVIVESHGGNFFVLGDVVARDGRVTTATGRALPRLEIDR